MKSKKKVLILLPGADTPSYATANWYKNTCMFILGK